jgi:phenylalanyl-tRNA synthetase beta chain
MDDQTLHVPQAKPVTLRVARAARVIGMPLTQAQCADALKRLGFAITEGEGTLTVTPPPHRFDLLIEEDLIEEVARLIGYNNLPTTAPLAPITARVRPEAQRSRFAVRRSVAALGYQETINFSFVEAHWEQDLAGNANPIKLLNPIASQMSVMRSSLLGSLLQVLKFNLDRKAPRVRVFELGRVFMRDDSVADHRQHRARRRPADARGGPCLGRCRRGALGRQAAAHRLLRREGRRRGAAGAAGADLRSGGASGAAPGPLGARDGRRQGHRLRRRTASALAPEVGLCPGARAVRARPRCRHGAPCAAGAAGAQAPGRAERDIAVVVAEAVTHDALMQAIRGDRGPGVAARRNAVRHLPPAAAARRCGGRDRGVGAGREEHGGAPELPERRATLTDEQVEPAVRAIVEQLGARLGGRLRG